MEIMKSGGNENFNLVRELYKHPSYVSQQKEWIQQWLESFWIK